DAGEGKAAPQDAGEGKAAPHDAGEGKAAPHDAGEGKAAPQDAAAGNAPPPDIGQSDASAVYAGVEDNPAPYVILNDLNEKYLEFHLYVTVKPISMTLPILSGLRVKIEQALEKNEIKLYRQTLEINVKDALKVLSTGTGLQMDAGLISK
ncbi:MAG: hypothetical protein LBQ79_04525, partial [Deltaproteobacteria bacterium]|nr:hypothetical protein [Deltaproteobacteria bacterium]